MEVALDQRHRGALDRDVGAGAHRDADLRLRQRRRVVDAVAGHRDDRCRGLKLAAPPAPSGRAGPRRRSRRCRAGAPTASAVVRLSPVSITTRMPSARSASSAAAAPSLTGSATVRSPAALPSTATNMTIWPSRRSSSRARVEVARVDRRAPQRARRLPTATRLPSTAPLTPFPVCEANAEGSARLSPRSAAPATMAAASGCSLARSRLAARRSSSSSAMPASGDDLGEPRLALGQGAGLVDDQGVDLLHQLERLGVLDEHAGARTAAGPDHDRHRRRQPERARAGDDQHRDRVDQREPQRRRRPEHGPHDEREHRRGDDAGHEPARDACRPAPGSARACAAPRPPCATIRASSVSLPTRSARMTN